MRNPSDAEKMFTSTGDKFWLHPQQMLNYRGGHPDTVISTHISPEGACNLKCVYCSVTYRKVSNRIDIDTIKRYVCRLMEYGLKAAIITGGGEPTLYPQFNQLIKWLDEMGIRIALITNGTQAKRVHDTTWGSFSWIRFSINLFDGWEQKIKLPIEMIPRHTTIGSSFVFTQKHEKPEQIDVDLLKRVGDVARKNGACYIRLLPNCLLPQASLLDSHKALDELLEKVNDPLFFHQYKVHQAPSCGTCHQSYFRPYLSEVPYGDTGIPGSVYPCDSVVLNDEHAQFVKKYQLCAPDDIEKYLRKEIKHQFDPRKDCTGCVFTKTVNMLDEWQRGELPQKFSDGRNVIHKDFV